MASDNDRPASALIDYVAVLIGPLLIMLMVGSLTFFLIDSIYAGNYPERLSHTMFFFVIGAVLIARIGILHGRGRASLYVLGLGAAVFLAMQAYVQYPPGLMRAIGPLVSLGLIAMIWWAANKLTWDCTHLDGERDAGGQGLLAATGLNEGDSPEGPPDADSTDDLAKEKKKPAEGLTGWVKRWNEYREKQKQKPHTPGTWVIYFGLACLPIFLLGQSLIPTDATDRRRWAFLEMAAFVASGLGLLVTTSLLGLKKYLEDRGAKIPGALTASWLGLGAILIAVFVTIGSLLPRPYSETPLVSLPRGAKENRTASQNAQVKGGEAGKGEGAKGSRTEAGDGKSNAQGGQPGGQGKKGEAKQGRGDQQGKTGSSGESKGNDKSPSNEKGDNSKGNQQRGEPAKSQQSQVQQSKGGQSKSDPPQGEPNQQDGNSTAETDSKEDSREGNRDGTSDETALAKTFESLGEGVKWIVWILMAIAVVAGVVVFFLKFLSPFTAWARNLLDWLKSLFGRRADSPMIGEEADDPEIAQRLPPFDSFDNPFRDGSASERSLPDLVRYTFLAFESWSADRDLARTHGETPTEFARRIREEVPEAESLERLANLVTRLAYSRRPLTDDASATLKANWQVMERLARFRAG